MNTKIRPLDPKSLIGGYLVPNRGKYNKPPVLVMGAGCSMPDLPSAIELKEEIAGNLIRISGAVVPKQDVLDRLSKRYFTLEVLGSVLVYHAGDSYDPVRFWRSMNQKAKISAASIDLARLKKAHLIGPIITINFDSFIYDAMGGDLTVVTEGNCSDYKTLPENALVAVHGTVIEGEAITNPSSIVSRGFTKPLSPNLYNLIVDLLTDKRRAVLFVGMSGGDHYDLNQLLADPIVVDSGIKQRCAWFSYQGDGSDLDAFVTGDYAESIVDCRANEVFKGVCEIRKLKRLRRKPKGCLLHWKKVVRQELQDITPEVAGAILSAILDNTVAPWVALEHYLLFSTGYEIKLANNMLGDDAKYYDIDLAEYLQAHVEYRSDNSSYRNLTELSDLESPQFGLSRDLYEKIVTNCESSLLECKSATDLAMINVIIASCHDYLGLMDFQHVNKLGSTSSAKVNRYREDALDRYRKCEEHAKRAEESFKNSSSEKGDFIPYDIWQVIARENRARVLPMPEKGEALKEAAQYRESIIDREKRNNANNYLLGHYPQCWLRWIEYAKSLLNCSGDDDIPNSVSSGEIINEVKYALRRAHEHLKSFECLSSHPNHRKAVIVDGEVCLKLAVGEIAAAEEQACEFEASLCKLDHKNPMWGVIIERSKKRISRVKARSS